MSSVIIKLIEDEDCQSCSGTGNNFERAVGVGGGSKLLPGVCVWCGGFRQRTTALGNALEVFLEERYGLKPVTPKPLHDAPTSPAPQQATPTTPPAPPPPPENVPYRADQVDLPPPPPPPPNVWINESSQRPRPKD